MNVYEIITDRIVKQLEAGVVPWRKPWGGPEGMPQSLATNKPYRGVNVFLLSAAGYASPYWVTFNHAKRMGCPVKKGEHGWPVVFWKFLDGGADEVADEGDGKAKGRAILRYFTVFNTSQCAGLDCIGKPAATGRTFSPIAACESVLAGLPTNRPKIRHGSAGAFYQPTADLVVMPDRERFDNEAGYYSVLFHELTHSTGHASRLNRDGITEKIRFGSSSYSREELIAEMGAAFLCGHCGIDTAPLTENHAAYVASWLGRLRGDSRLVIQAAGAAQKASDWLLGRSAGQSADNAKDDHAACDAA